LETAKIAQVLDRMGHTNFYFAGELDAPGAVTGPIAAPVKGSMLVPQAHFTHPEVKWITENAFGTHDQHPLLETRILTLAVDLKAALKEFIVRYAIDVLVVQNVFAIPMNIALAVALEQVIEETGIRTISHNHDFYWEREKYLTNCIPDLLETYFPPRLPEIRHLVINTQAQRDLAKRGLQSVLLPNIFDFDLTPPGVDAYNQDLRSALGLAESDLFFLQPTRVIPRKGIELAIELVHRLADLPIKLIITHHAEYDSLDYLAGLHAQAERLQVDLRYVPERFQPQRQAAEGAQKIYSLWDAYVYADFVTYPSLYEGFGNALIETLFFRKPFLVNRYSVYRDDIEPTGLQAVTIDSQITDQTVAQVRELLTNPQSVAAMARHNAEVATAHFSYLTAQRIFEKLFAGYK
jgi:glycosyltransferase involved in cell wall biosynthesis